MGSISTGGNRGTGRGTVCTFWDQPLLKSQPQRWMARSTYSGNRLFACTIHVAKAHSEHKKILSQWKPV